MPNPNENKIAIITSIQPVGSWQMTLARQYFAMHLSLGVYKPPSPIEYPEKKNLPWDWDWDEDSLVVIGYRAAANGTPAAYDVFKAELFLDEKYLATPHFISTNLDRVQKAWIKSDADSAWDPTIQPSPTARNTASTSLPEQLIYLSTFPGDLPQHLRLLFYFRVNAFFADGWGKNKNVKLEEITNFVVAPRISKLKLNPPEDFLFNELTEGTENWKRGWTYKDDANGYADRAAFVKPLNVSREAGKPINFSDDGHLPPRGLDFWKFWFREPVILNPWTEKLDHQALEVFHTFDRLCDAASLDGAYRLDFQTQINWGPDLIPHIGTQLSGGPLPPSGTWQRLRVSTAPLEGKQCTGISFTAHKGHVTWGPIELKRGTETTFFLKEMLPSGSTQLVDPEWDAQAWGEWQADDRLKVTGVKVHESRSKDNSATDVHRQAFNGAGEIFDVKTGDELFVYVLLEEKNPPDEIMLEFANPWWDQLRLKALAFNAQWDTPSPEANPTDPRNPTDVLVGQLVTLLLGKPAPDVEKAVRGRLELLRTRLADKTIARSLWLTLLAASSSTSEQTRAIFEAVRDRRELLDLMLFVQWSPLFIKSNDSALKDYLVEPLSDRWAAISGDGELVKPVLALFTNEVRFQQQVSTSRLLKSFAPADFATEANAAKKLTSELNLTFSYLKKNPLPALDTMDFSAEAVWKDYVAEYQKRIEKIFKDHDENGKHVLTKPGGLSIKVDDLAKDDDVRPIDDGDVWRKLSGAGLMIRERPRGSAAARRWHILSAANVHLKGDSKNLFELPALVPVRVPYRNGVRYPVFTYNDKSLVAPNPLGDAVTVSGGFGIKDNSSAKASASQYEYSPVLKNGGPDYDGLRLQHLVFGNEYELAAFMIDTAGGLPNELAMDIATESIPWILDYDKWAAGKDIVDPDADHRTGFKKYLREVPIGQTRVRLELKNGSVNYPEIPPRVFPRAKEIEDNNTQEPDSTKPESRDLPALPLLMVHPTLSSTDATLRLRLPTAELELIEQWPGVATDAGFKNLLINYHERLLKLPAATIGADSNYDSSLDDPAVSQILVVVEEFKFNKGLGNETWQPVNWEVVTPAVHPNPQEIDNHQKESSILFHVEKDANEYSLEKTGETLILKTPDNKAAIARLSIYTLVPRLTVQEFFPTDFLKSEDGALELNELTFSKDIKAVTNANVCLKPYRLLVERPSPAMPSAQQLWQAIHVSRTSLDTVAVDIKPDDVATDPSVRERFSNVVSVDVLKQPWRWQGRRIDNDQEWLKGKQISDTDQKVLEWEAGAFAQMDDLFDTLSIPLPYHFDQAGAKDAAPLYTDHFDKDMRAYYLRYGARAHSRYEGLLASANSSVTSKQPVDGRALSGIGWKRAFVPFRGPKPPKPVIKAVVPLTQCGAESAQKHSPAPLMIVLDETMFSFCGITEYIECEIERISMPEKDKNPELVDCAGDVRSHLFQVGHDPTLFKKETPAGQPSDYACVLTGERASLPCDDPVGYTFDTDARQPLFSTSSLIVHPYFPDLDVGLRSWDFARLRFRRVNRVAPHQAIPDAYDDTEWTKPLWVQFLPPSSFDIWNTEGTEKYVANAKNVLIPLPAHADPNSVGLGPSLDHERFSYRVLVTKVVTDFQGNRDHEQIVTLNPPLLIAEISADEKSLGFNIPDGINPDARYRLLEIHRRPNAPVEDAKFWNNLLESSESSDPKDAEYRITRVSPFFLVE